MIERVLYQAILDGAQYLAADTHRLDSIFQPEGSTVRVSNAEMAKIRADWTDYVINLRFLRHGYATEAAMVPCYAIVMTSDEPKQEYLGNLAEVTFDRSGTPDETQERIGLIEDRTFNVVVYGIGVEQCAYHYKILKNIILMQLKRLQQYWLITPKISGQELQPLDMGLPKLVYLRTLTVKLGVEEYYDQILTDTPVLITGVDVHRDNQDGNGGILGVEVLP